MSAHAVDPHEDRREPGTGKGAAIHTHLLGFAKGVAQFYALSRQRVALLITSLVLCYGGGGALFWFHCIYRGEHGPAINPWAHWGLDSTLGFIGLTPAIVLLLPTVSWLLAHPGSPAKLGPSALLLGSLFAVVTAPGPLAHDLLVGRGTGLAHVATKVIGYSARADHAHAVAHSLVDESLLQVLVGIPVYTALAFLALVTVDQLARFGIGRANERG
jgi:hypothetical protein